MNLHSLERLEGADVLKRSPMERSLAEFSQRNFTLFAVVFAVHLLEMTAYEIRRSFWVFDKIHNSQPPANVRTGPFRCQNG